MTRRTSIRLALLDRDGTLNAKAPDDEYVCRRQDLVVFSTVPAALRRLNDANVRVAVVSNQRGVARGRMTLADVADVNAELHRVLARVGAWIDLLLVCPHEANTCRCRKPEPGLLLKAGDQLGIPMHEAVMVGDSNTDAEAGRRAGARTISLGESDAADNGVPDFESAVDMILNAG